MLECTNEPLMFSFCKAQMKKMDPLLGHLHMSSYKLYLLLFLEVLTHAVSYFSNFQT